MHEKIPLGNYSVNIQWGFWTEKHQLLLTYLFNIYVVIQENMVTTSSSHQRCS